MRGQKGVTLVETIIALAILMAIAVSVFLALNVSLKTTAKVDQNTTAESLARTVLEVIKQCDYDDTAPYYQDCIGTIDIPDRYDVVVCVGVAAGIPEGQEITVKVCYDGDCGCLPHTDTGLVMTTVAYKVDR